MATLETYGFEDLDDVYKKIMDIPWEVTESALNGMAAVAAEKVKSQGEAMGVRDPESDVHILDKIVLRKAKKTEFGGVQNISFSGSRTRGEKGTKTRNAEIAFIKEYGKRTQAARPFISTALNQYTDQITNPGADAILDWIEKEWKN